MSKKRNATDKPGSLSYYLKEAGWEVVPQEEGFPLWRKMQSEAISGSKALLEVYREIWRKTKATNAEDLVKNTQQKRQKS